ncbi:hypothetical protein BDZ91DRAFT_837034 [Kalaharituber pfeilii]|nr:hypothetical protein BDZ91DRAFT_837034 [Kalaharituber pfeilii]
MANSQFRRIFHSGDSLTPEEADVPCNQLSEETIFQSLRALTGLNKDSAERFRKWMREDIRYFILRKFDFGLAYAAARVGWKHFNGPVFDVGAQRAQWFEKAKAIDEERSRAINKDSTGQELIHSPYSVMPRRIWDLKSNRVVEFRMLHGAAIAVPANGPQLPPTFWAVSHSWTSDMKTVEISVNQYLWPVPLPEGVELERNVRKELLSFGADYVWLDVLCLRQSAAPSQHSHDAIQIKQHEWKTDVPTIGNIYRAAEHVVRYFNGLGKPFSKDGWDDHRHWLRRAWTLQEIKKEKMTFNGGVPYNDGKIILNTQGKVGGKVITLRAAIRPVVKLATDADRPSGCRVYELAKEMAHRYASNPTDKVAGMFYLLRTTQLPTYNENISDETAWRQCFHVLPFGRKIEILFDFPYRGAERQWFPMWRQLMEWPDCDPDYEHSTTKWPQSCRIPELTHLGTGLENKASLFVPDVWAILHVLLRKTSNREYQVKKGTKLLGYYCPYLSQEAIETDYRLFTLATLELEHTHNWVVCEELSTQFGGWSSGTGGDSTVKLRVLKKVGVLRMDSISRLMTVEENSGPIVKKIHALFVDWVFDSVERALEKSQLLSRKQNGNGENKRWTDGVGIIGLASIAQDEEEKK